MKHRYEHSLRILQISIADGGGGAEKVAWDLHRSYRDRGYPAWLAVGFKHQNDPYVLRVPNHLVNPATWLLQWVEQTLDPLTGKIRGLRRVQNWISRLGGVKRWWNKILGHEDFNFPGTWHILKLPPDKPDIVHCHNLHGGYFDLRALPWLTSHAPVMLTLHDAWLLSGHCAHSFDCERWESGCGSCPDLTIYPAICRDGTASNWRRKQTILAASRFYVCTPSNWLMRKVKRSILAPAIIESRVVPNGVDLTIFKPGDRRAARKELGLPEDADVLLFVGHSTSSNLWKDYETMKDAVYRLARQYTSSPLLLIAVGEAGASETVGNCTSLFVGYENNPRRISLYYQAADVYIHAAKVDTFPNTVLEALACGLPVIATAVGGIPEQVNGLASPSMDPQTSALNVYGLGHATGMLIPPRDAAAMASSIETLLINKSERLILGRNAAKDAMNRFDLKLQVDQLLKWYQTIIANTDAVH